ncbi:MAG: hypothetical protein CVV50_01390 [Spirochaetae bacterium HGW-Spirochaetae-6]|nr:MAG: hypothetical protein CVV50_01390 [Spirochaetae bacterium HGW-Spirochaetae-6]
MPEECLGSKSMKKMIVNVALLLCLGFGGNIWTKSAYRFDLSKDHLEVMDWIVFYTNMERVKRGLLPLIYDKALNAPAFYQAYSCMKSKYLSHENGKTGLESVSDRILQGGRTHQAAGENIAYFSLDNWENFEIAREAVKNWMNSSGHRANILNNYAIAMGAGVAFSKEEKKDERQYAYTAQVFAGYAFPKSVSENKEEEAINLFVFRGKTLSPEDEEPFPENMDFASIRLSKEGNVHRLENKKKYLLVVFTLSAEKGYEIIRKLEKSENATYEKNPEEKNDSFLGIFTTDEKVLYPLKKL